METINESTPVCMVTIGQLLAFARRTQETAGGTSEAARRKEVNSPQTQEKYVYGLRGIRNRYGVGVNTACNWANGLLAPAVVREGRKIMLNTEKADKILEQWTQEHPKGK